MTIRYIDYKLLFGSFNFCFLASHIGYASPHDLMDTQVIRLNQVGFSPNATKIAIVLTSATAEFKVVTLPGKTEAFKGMLTESASVALNGKKTCIANFSALHTEGKYAPVIAGIGSSCPFSVIPAVYKDVAAASIKAYYYQRASTPLPKPYAGKLHREEGHPDNKSFIHASAATLARPTGTVIATPGGWYDAGYYNKYVVNSGVTMGTLLALYEDFPEYIKKTVLNIPEGSNTISDIQDKILCNLRWMLKMQDPNDGGVYNKLTNACLDGMVMPQGAKTLRYVVQKDTVATLDFAAVTAQASRIFKKYPDGLPGLDDYCIHASASSWQWAQKNPSLIFDQDAMNRRFEPKITTGGYGDRNFGDELSWAATELFISTGDQQYLNALNLFSDELRPLPLWGNVRLLSYYSILRNESRWVQGKGNITLIKKRLIALADDLSANADNSAYETAMGKNKGDFGWRSNLLAATQTVALVQVYRVTGNKRYLDCALGNLDYLLGRNTTGYCYLIGFGYKSPMDLHHRQSEADGITEPVSGFLVGGPNPSIKGGIQLASTVAEEVYIDDSRTYAVDKIAINWNTPFAYLANALESIKAKAGYVGNINYKHDR